MIIPIDASYLYFFVVHKQQRQPLVNNIHVFDDTEGVSTAVHVMSIVQSERKCAPCSRDPGMFYYHATGHMLEAPRCTDWTAVLC